MVALLRTLTKTYGYKNLRDEYSQAFRPYSTYAGPGPAGLGSGDVAVTHTTASRYTAYIKRMRPTVWLKDF